ncbi:MAG: YggS family pyridoxal phosphate-dependent enzyme, partial [Thermomicrobiaceae bacterium]|nr:YggS family pyridoxal phosphate-dependent enzyme [Thermomicrobiaceae bacterium]
MTVAALETNVRRVLERVARAAERSGRSPDAVTVVAVTKTVGRAAVDEAYALGLRQFGENRVQDARAKFSDPLPDDARLHLIGYLQTNKARDAVALFDMVQSVDRPSLIDALQRRAAQVGKTLDVLVQVNVARESQKHGCAPEDALDVVRRAAAQPNLRVRGLMTIAPLVSDPE